MNIERRSTQETAQINTPEKGDAHPEEQKLKFYLRRGLALAAATAFVVFPAVHASEVNDRNTQIDLRENPMGIEYGSDRNHRELGPEDCLVVHEGAIIREAPDGRKLEYGPEVRAHHMTNDAIFCNFEDGELRYRNGEGPDDTQFFGIPVDRLEGIIPADELEPLEEASDTGLLWVFDSSGTAVVVTER